ncbi:MAG: DUF2284 domain-containing protein [Clostridia bacterium]|nr:DUF2284 domain-containing protein [Clostridia bacterium]
MIKDDRELLQFVYNSLKDKYQHIHITPINLEDIVFEERVKMNCFYCGKYGTNWRCPPKIPDIDYKQMFSECSGGAFVYLKMPLDEDSYDDVRNESTLALHKALLDMEKMMWEHNRPMAISFIGGSCKLCKNGCGKEKCNNPYMSRSPVEALGINVIKSAEKYGIDIVFPPGEYMLRLGLLLW